MSSSFYKEPNNPSIRGPFRPINSLPSIAPRSSSREQALANRIDKYLGTEGVITKNTVGTMSLDAFNKLPKDLQDPVLRTAVEEYAKYKRALEDYNIVITKLNVPDGNTEKASREFRKKFQPINAPKFYSLFQRDVSHYITQGTAIEDAINSLNFLSSSPYNPVPDLQSKLVTLNNKAQAHKYWASNVQKLNTLYSRISHYYWVTKDMEYLVLDGATDIASLNFATDAISPNGFIFFDRSFYPKDLIDNTVNVFEYAGTVYSKENISPYVFEESLPIVDYMSWCVYDGMLHITVGAYRDIFGLVTSTVYSLPMDVDITADVVFKSIAHTLDPNYRQNTESLLMEAYMAWVITRVLGSFFALCTSPGITSVRDVSTGSVRNVSLPGLDKPGQVVKSSNVHIIDIRPLKHRKGTAGTGRKLTKRFEVRGHWRMQPYANGVIKKIWIQGYIKGPEGAPLVLRDKVFRLV